jgi:hypothetical protein
MGILIKLFGKRSKSSDTQNRPPQITINKPSVKEIFESPPLLANWVFLYAVNIFSIEDDFRHAPSNEVKDNLNITNEQIERLVREESILRAVGASFFVKQKYDSEFYNKYFSHLYTPVAIRIYSKPNNDQVTDTKESLEQYINFISNEEDKELRAFSQKYITRIYHDNDNYIKMLASDIPNLAISSSLAIYKAMGNAYHKVKQGNAHKS